MDYKCIEQQDREAVIMKDNSIKVVYDSDLVSLLESLNVLENVMKGECVCVFCGRVISIDNIDGIIPMGDDISFSCNESACRLKLVGEVNNDCE